MEQKTYLSGLPAIKLHIQPGFNLGYFLVVHGQLMLVVMMSKVCAYKSGTVPPTRVSGACRDDHGPSGALFCPCPSAHRNKRETRMLLHTMEQC